jgi:hypothetical protein
VSSPTLREYHAPWPDRVEPGRGLAVIMVESETQRLVLLADMPWNRGASMTNAIEAVIRTVVADLLEPQGIDWRSVSWVERDSMGNFDVPRPSGPPRYFVTWSPLVAPGSPGCPEHRRTELAFSIGFGADAEAALATYHAMVAERNVERRQ